MSGNLRMFVRWFALALIVVTAGPRVTVPCNWDTFPRRCAEDRVCGWNCWTLEIRTIRDCYQNGSGCCMCVSERRDCQCLFSDYYAYKDKRVQMDYGLCIESWITVPNARGMEETLPDDRCMESEPPGG